MSEEDPSTGEARTEETSARALPFAALLLAAAIVPGVLALVLFLAFAALGLAGAPYGSVGAAVVGGIALRRGVLRDPSAAEVVLFTICSIGGAVAGLWLGEALLA